MRKKGFSGDRLSFKDEIHKTASQCHCISLPFDRSCSYWWWTWWNLNEIKVMSYLVTDSINMNDSFLHQLGMIITTSGRHVWVWSTFGHIMFHWLGIHFQPYMSFIFFHGIDRVPSFRHICYGIDWISSLKHTVFPWQQSIKLSGIYVIHGINLHSTIRLAKEHPLYMQESGNILLKTVTIL